MTRSRRRGITALAAAAALTAGTLVAVLPAAAETNAWIDAGDLTISTSTNAVTFDGETQPLGSSGCNLTPTSGDLLEFAGFVGDASAPVGYKSGSIGVNERVSALCNLVDPATTEGGGIESLELALGDGLVNFAGRPLQASGASLDIRMGVRTLYTFNRKSTVTAQAFLAGEEVGAPFTLIQGTGVSAGTTTYCAFSSYGQTCAWDIAPPGRFDTLRLTAVAGAFGVVGESTLDLVSDVDQALNCDPDDENADPTLTQGNVSVEYIGNAITGECSEFGVTLEAGDEEIVFLKPLDLDPDAQFIFDVEWTQAIAGPAATVPTVTIDFENYADGSVTPIVSDMPFCPEALYAAGELVGVQEEGDLAAIQDWRDDLPGTQYACLDQPRSVEISGGTLTVTDKVFLIGDARMRLG